MENFNRAFEVVMGIEGGYGNNPTDRGGETVFGVSRIANPSWSGWQLVDAHKRAGHSIKTINSDKELFALAKELYKKLYWDINRCDDINEYNICLELFDVSVNMGPFWAAKFLQQALNALNKNQSLFQDLSVDGRIGPATLAAVKIIVSRNEVSELVLWMNVLQGARYLEIMQGNPSQETFARGWAKRIELVRK